VVVEKSPLHSKCPKKAKRKRKLVKSPVNVNCPGPPSTV
jgi:hypothetical protein